MISSSMLTADCLKLTASYNEINFFAGGDVDVVDVLSGTVRTGGQSIAVCCGESSSFFMSSNLISLVGGSTGSALVV